MEPSELTRAVWEVDAEAFPADAPVETQARFLLRYAILAPSSHNAQPWTFTVRDDAVEVAPDEARWLTVADPDQRELHISVGCAVENLFVAAERFGFDPAVDHQARPDDTLTTVVTLRPAGDPSRRPAGLFDELSARYTSHGPFEDRALPAATLDRLRRSVRSDDVSLHLVEDPGVLRSVGELQAEADEALMDDPAYRRELGHWVGTGALGSSWLLARVGQAVVTHLDLGEREGKKNSTLVQSAPVVGVLTTPADDPVAWVEVGRVFERLALVASAEDVAVHPMSQTLERPDRRTELAAVLGLDEAVPQHLFRLGFADEAPEHTPRWPVENVLSDGQ